MSPAVHDVDTVRKMSALSRFPPCGAREIQLFDAVIELAPDLSGGVQKLPSVLRDVNDLYAEKAAHVLFPQQIPPAEEKNAALHPHVVRQKAHDRKRGHRFAGAGLTDQRGAFSGAEPQADAVHQRAVCFFESGEDLPAVIVEDQPTFHVISP